MIKDQRGKTKLSEITIQDFPKTFPASVSIRQWKLDALEAIQDSVGTEYEAATTFFNEMETNTIEELAKQPKGWDVVDNKLLIICKSILQNSGTQEAEILERRDEARELGGRINGRQLIKLMYEECYTDEHAKNFYQIGHLRSLRWIDSVPAMQEFVNMWRKIKRGMKTLPTEDELTDITDILWRQFQESNALNFDVHMYQRSEGAEAATIRTEEWMLQRIINHIKRTKYQNNQARLDKSLAPGTSKQHVAAPAAPTKGRSQSRGSKKSSRTGSSKSSKSSTSKSSKASSKGGKGKQQKGKNGGGKKGQTRGRSADKNKDRDICYEHKNAGKCTRENCPWRHVDASPSNRQKRKPSPADRNNCVNAQGICKWYAEGTCRFGAECLWPHFQASAPATPTKNKGKKNKRADSKGSNKSKGSKGSKKSKDSDKKKGNKSKSRRKKRAKSKNKPAGPCVPIFAAPSIPYAVEVEEPDAPEPPPPSILKGSPFQ